MCFRTFRKIGMFTKYKRKGTEFKFVHAVIAPLLLFEVGFCCHECFCFLVYILIKIAL